MAGVLALGLLPTVALVQSSSFAATEPGVGTLGKSETGLWIVQLEEPSLATYEGGIAGLEATSPEVTGAPQLDVNTPEARAYLAHVQDGHDEFAHRAERALGRDVALEREYHTVLNAVAVEAEPAEAARLVDLPGVAAVYPETIRELATDVSHETIGSPSIWNGDTGTDVGTRGEGVLVGVLDSGINPDHPSFAAVDGDGYQHENPLGEGRYLGVCDPGNTQQPNESICNDKLVGAWAFDYRSLSAIDSDGHGTHTAATAVGNVHEATFPVGDSTFTRIVSGVAPRANLVTYRVCVADCPITAILAGIDQAVTDGVDVLNYSISGSDDPWNDPVELAFLEATNAGVFVAAAAGNNGPEASTVAHTGPWVTAVAATTTSRVFAQTLDVTEPDAPDGLTGVAAVPGAGGPGVTEPIEAPIVDAGTVDAGNERACSPLPTGAFDGAIALIERGTCSFDQKVEHAAAAGADAVVVTNTAGGPPTTMGGLAGTTIPAVMIDRTDGHALRAFLADTTGPVLVRLNPETELVTDTDWANVVADFSSRGPSRFDLVAPTLAAPGVNILAAGAGGADRYEVMQGTSMASPHVAGAGALMTALHADWSPTQIRSALASSADPQALVAGNGMTDAGIFEQGAGLMDLNAAARAGLVLDETYANFLAADPAPSVGGDPRTLNLPALVDSDCAGSCTWTRTVTNVADTTATYTARVDTPNGLNVTVSPATITLEPGQSRTVEFVAEVVDLPAREWTTASVSWSTSSTHASGVDIAETRFPVAVIPAAAQLTVEPGRIIGEQAPGTRTEHTVTIGNTGGLDLSWRIAGEDGEQGRTLRPAGRTAITATAPEQAEASAGPTLARNPRYLPSGTDTGQSAPQSPDQAEGTTTLTHSESQRIVPNNTVACSAEGLTADNGYLRTFTLEDFAIHDDFEVTEVSFGVEAVNLAPSTVTVRLYTLDAEPLTYGNLTEIGSADVTLTPQALRMVTVPVRGTVPAGSTLVVELDAPDTSLTSGFFPGSNAEGETAPSYLRSEACGIPEPSPMSALGFPGTHLVMNVTGVTDSPDTRLPEWVDVQPASGTVAAGRSQDVTVSFDSTGMSPGETYEATLVVESNDPNRPFVPIPLSLVVTEDGGQTPGGPSEASEEIVVTVPEDSDAGSLLVSVDPNDRTVRLPELTSVGDRLSTSGELRPVTVSDTRDADPGWDVSAQVSDFSSTTASFGGGFLGWLPLVESVTEGQVVLPGLAVDPGFPTGDGLSVPRVLASAAAGSGKGSAVLGAEVRLEVPTNTTPGVYTALLTVTAI